MTTFFIVACTQSGTQSGSRSKCGVNLLALEAINSQIVILLLLFLLSSSLIITTCKLTLNFFNGLNILFKKYNVYNL